MRISGIRPLLRPLVRHCDARLFSSSTFVSRGEDWGNRSNSRADNRDNRDSRDNRDRGYNNRSDRSYQDRNSNRDRDRNRDRGYSRDNGSNRSYGSRNRNSFRRNDRNSGRRDDDDDWLITRTRSKRRVDDDGLMGLENYEIDAESIKTLKYEDLLPSTSSEVPGGMSPVATSVLAEKRLVSRPLVNSLIHHRRYEWLTPVQAQTLLPILRNESVVVRAKTGTGKTAAFVIPALQKALEARSKGISNKVVALIISPTRELAQQIADEAYAITQFGGLRDIKVQSLVGGLSKGSQMRQAGLDRGQNVADIIVATPGRLLDVMDEPGVLEHFNQLQFRVFDEADRLLDIGFEGILQQIHHKLEDATPNASEIPLLLFSATADANVRRFARSQFGDRVRVVDTVPKDEPTANELVEQVAVACPTWREAYEGAARAIVEAAEVQPDTFKAVVFLPTVAMVDNFENIVRNMLPRDSNVRRNTAAIHGQRTQASRQRRADAFRSNPAGILITTDVVARGMDFPLVSHVYQIGVPPDVPSYVHRIGRTARIGNRGKSLLFYTNHVRGYLAALAREGIRPQPQTYEPDHEFNKKFEEVALKSVGSDDEANVMLNTLLSYMSVIKAKFNVEPHQFLADMQPFVELYGLEDLKLSPSNRDTWKRGQQRKRGGRPSFGSSRRSRFRF